LKITSGAAGAGGVIYHPRGIKLLSFSRGLGQTANSFSEALALLKGCELAISHGVTSITIIGDS